MIRLRVTSTRGADARDQHLAKFPCLLGRAAECDVQLDAPGVWARHARLDLGPAGTFTLTPLPNALAVVNGKPFTHGRLHHGDLIELGAARVQFWLADTRQKRLALRETSVWLTLAAVLLAEAILIRQLLQ